MEKSAEILSDITVFNKYAKHLKSHKRRENLAEIVYRNIDMHVKKFPHMEEDILWAFNYVLDKKVLPSMRAFQFAGLASELNPTRLYNCSFVAIDDLRAFSEAMFLLLSGCGLGFSVQTHHVEKLPEVLGPNENKHKRYLVSDSIEGWADAIKAVIDSYFKGKLRLQFDYRGIRPKGTRLVTSGGKAPGPQPLKDCIHNIEKVLDNAIAERGRHTKLKPIEAHDIICHISNAVMAGGIRRAACISLFSFDDTEMLNCKSGSWWELNAHRGRANNSVVLDRRKVDKESFDYIWERVKASGCGEPGIVFTNDPYNYGMNPCLPKWSTVLTPDGLRTLGDISVGDKIWSREGWTTVVDKWSTGVKDVYKYETTFNRFYGTENHRIVSNGVKVEAKDAESIDRIVGQSPEHNEVDICDVMDGLVVGDGSVHKASNNLVYLFIGDGDSDYFDSIISPLIKKSRFGLSPKAYEIATNITSEELPKTFMRRVPSRYMESPSKIIGFLHGLYSANGTVVGNRISLKSASKGLIEDVQLMLNTIGIKSYYTTNKPKTVTFSNGGYECRQSYDLNITTDRALFMSKIGFIQKYKNDKVALDNSARQGRKSGDIVSVEYVSTEEVFDITVDNESHTFWSNGCDVSNCAEISLKSCSFCNLTTINVSDVYTQEEFENRVRAATIIGTIQASYTDFHYLRDVWKRNAESEALLGVSMTGIASGSVMSLDIKKAAKYAVQVNREIADKIGIKHAKRITTIKPEGCQVKDTFVSTRQGILMLDEIGDCGSGDKWQDHSYEVYTDRGIKNSPKFYVNGFAETNVITLDSGLVLEATNAHKYRVISNGEYVWKCASDIQIGDVIPYSIGEYDGGSYRTLTSINKNPSRYAVNTHEIKQPNILNEDIAWFVGVYTGDGSNHSKGIRIHGDYTQQKGFGRIIKILRDYFGITAKVVKYNDDPNDKRCAVYANSNMLLDFLSANGLLKGKSKDIEIPKIIRQSPKSVILSFVDGYAVADGCDKNRDRSFCTTSHIMAKQLPIVLRAVGIDCKVRLMPPTDSSHGTSMRYWIQERKGRSSDRRYQKNWRKNAWDVLDKNGFGCDMSVDMVVGVTKSMNETYDIEVDDTHTFIANSYISHNTSSLVLGCSSGVHAYHAPYYIRRMRINKDEALYTYLKTNLPELVEDEYFDPTHTAVLSMPVKSPDGAIMRDESPIHLLNRVKKLHDTWIKGGHISGANSHNVSVTVSIKDGEWDEVGDWMWVNRESYNGISVLPADGGSYMQTPFEDCTEETYNKMFEYVKSINIDDVVETEDIVDHKETVSCAGGACEIR